MEADLNGRGPFHLLLDTGSNITVIDPRSAQAVTGRAHAPGDGLKLASLRCGPMALRDHMAMVHDLGPIGIAFGSSLDGILGFPAFGDWLLTLDYPNRRIEIARGELPSVTAPDILPFRSDGRPHIAARLSGEARSFLIDSGASAGILLSGDLREQPIERDPVRIATYMGIDGPFASEGARLSINLHLGGWTIETPIVGSTPRESLIGTEIMRHFRWTFDQRRSRVRLERDSRAPITTPPIRSIGALLTPVSEGMRVARIAPGGPAERPGLRPGDIIDSMNGAKMKWTAASQLRGIVSASRHIILGVIRDGDRLALELEAEDIVP